MTYRAIPSSWFWIPIALFLIFVPLSPSIDMTLSSSIYNTDGFISQHDTSHPFLHFLYNYGNRPGQVLAGVAAAVVALSFFYPRLRPYRNITLVFGLTATLGALILINGILKDFWGRPRPKQVVEFGGRSDYQPLYSPLSNRVEEKQSSFPSGHAAMGFLFLSLAVCGWCERNSKLVVLGLLLGLGGGVLLSTARMLQGAHFFSDVATSAFIMWMIALIMARIIYRV